MARSYTITEVVKIVNEGTDLEAISDIGRRYPLLLAKVSKVTALAGDAIADFFGYFPEYLSANKINKALKAEIEGTEPDTADDDQPETPEPKKAKKDEKPKKAKKAAKPKKAKKDPEPEPEPDTEEQEDGPYAGKNAMELFKECKKRGIKAAPKKPVKYYVELLEEFDEADNGSDADDEDDDWDI